MFELFRHSSLQGRVTLDDAPIFSREFLFIASIMGFLNHQFHVSSVESLSWVLLQNKLRRWIDYTINDYKSLASSYSIIWRCHRCQNRFLRSFWETQISYYSSTKASLSEPGRSVMLAGRSREELRVAGAFRSIRPRSVIRGIDRGALGRREWRLWRRVARELAELSIPVP